MSDELREQLADVQHAIWAHWMRYQFSQCLPNGFGGALIPSDKAGRWRRQMDTPYSDLTDKERESDRHQADKVLAVVQPELDQLRAALNAAEARITRYEALETTCRSKHRHATIHDAFCCDLMLRRAEQAEAKLAAVPHNAFLRMSYGAQTPEDEHVAQMWIASIDWQAVQP